MWRKKDRRRGAASLVLAVVTGACLVVFSVFLQGARIRAAECALLRAVTAAADGALSSYCGVLLQRYGIFAFDREDSGWEARTGAVFEADRPKIALHSELDLETGAPLSAPEVLRSSIRRFVLERVPALALAGGLNRWTALARGGRIASIDPLFDTGGEEDTGGNAWQAVLMQALENSGSTGEKADRTPDDPGYDIGDASMDLRDGLLAIAEMNRGSMGDPTVPMLPSPLDPDAVGSFLERTIDAMPDAVSAWIDSAAIDLYAVSMFRSRVLEGVEKGVRHPFRDLRGRTLSGLSSVRPHEVEFLIVGRSEDDENVAAVERRILALRLALHLLAQTVDDDGRAKARAFAQGISALLSAATSGSLVVPSEFLTVAIQVAWAFGRAEADMDLLVEGRSVALLPAALARVVPELASWETDYADYLAVLLVAVPDTVKLERIAETIDGNLALFGASSATDGGVPLEEFCTSVRASTRFRGDEIAAVARYGDEAA